VTNALAYSCRSVKKSFPTTAAASQPQRMGQELSVETG
jgi:hypothetical protein